MPQISLLYAGLLALVSLYLAYLCGNERGRSGVAIGDGDDLLLQAAMRRHANFVEYVPLALILIALLELNGVSHTAIHSFGGSLLFFRLAHAFGMRADAKASPGRVIGAAGTFLLIVIMSGWAIAQYFL